MKHSMKPKFPKNKLRNEDTKMKKKIAKVHPRIKGRSTLFALWSCNIFWEWTGGSEPTQGDISGRPLWISHRIHFVFLIASILDFSSHPLWISHRIHFGFLIASTLYFSSLLLCISPSHPFWALIWALSVPLQACKAPGSQSFQIATNSMTETVQLNI